MTLSFGSVTRVPKFGFFGDILTSVVRSRVNLGSTISILRVGRVNLTRVTPYRGSTNSGGVLIFGHFGVHLGVVQIINLHYGHSFGEVLTTFLRDPRLVCPSLLLFIFKGRGLNGDRKDYVYIVACGLSVFGDLNLYFNETYTNGNTHLGGRDMFCLVTILLGGGFKIYFFFVTHGDILRLRATIFLGYFCTSFTLVLFLGGK